MTEKSFSFHFTFQSLLLLLFLIQWKQPARVYNLLFYLSSFIQTIRNNSSHVGAFFIKQWNSIKLSTQQLTYNAFFASAWAKFDNKFSWVEKSSHSWCRQTFFLSLVWFKVFNFNLCFYFISPGKVQKLHLQENFITKLSSKCFQILFIFDFMT